MRDVVIGVDASTTAVKAIGFDRAGRALHEARFTYPLSSPQPGFAEQDPEDWWKALTSALREVAEKLGPNRIAALSIAHQRETFTLVDAVDNALHPGILWLDERARPQVARLSAQVGRDLIREWTGKPPDPTPALYAVAWLTEHRPEAVRDAALVLDVNGYFIRRLTGLSVTSTSSADPLGLLDTREGKWRPELAQAAGLRMEQLPNLDHAGDISGELTPDAAALCGLPASLPVVAGAGDGQAMGLGMGVVRPGDTYLSLGSGVVSGTFSPTYATSDAYRTLTASSNTGFMMETVLRSGMQLIEWVLRTTGTSDIAALAREAAEIAPGSDNLLLLPYFSGVMSPYWDETARGALLGLSLAHSPAHILRAAMEGIAMEQAVATDALEADIGIRSQRMIVAGGGTKSDLLMTIMASVLERPLAVSPVNEAAALGAAMLAAKAVGWHGSIEEAAAAMATPPTRQVDPDPRLVEAYRARLAIYSDLYRATSDIHARLAKLGE